MSKFSVARHVPYTADQIFAIASDVASYSTFLPLVRRSTVSNRKDLGDGREGFESELVITYKKLGISEVMRSTVITDKTKRLVTATSGEDGPIKSLDSGWRIVPGANGGCDIELAIDYTLKSRSLQFLLSGMFDLAVRRIMTAFEDRAKELYGAAAA